MSRVFSAATLTMKPPSSSPPLALFFTGWRTNQGDSGITGRRLGVRYRRVAVPVPVLPVWGPKLPVLVLPVRAASAAVRPPVLVLPVRGARRRHNHHPRAVRVLPRRLQRTPCRISCLCQYVAVHGLAVRSRPCKPRSNSSSRPPCNSYMDTRSPLRVKSSGWAEREDSTASRVTCSHLTNSTALQHYKMSYYPDHQPSGLAETLPTTSSLTRPHSSTPERSRSTSTSAEQAGSDFQSYRSQVSPCATCASWCATAS